MITVVGSVNMDLVVKVSRHPVPGETLLGSDYATNPGGKGANQAVAASRLGEQVRFVGRIGSDAFAQQLRAALEHDGVDTTELRVASRPSGVAFIQVDDAGQNSIVVSPGANFALHPADLPDAAFDGADVVLLQLEIILGTVRAAARKARQAGAQVILNVAPAQLLSVEDLKDVTVLLVNEYEAAILLGRDASVVAQAPLDAVQELTKLVGRAVLTLGELGAAWAERGENGYGSMIHATVRAGHVPAIAVDVVDTTAAGDAFAGALAVRLARYPAAGLEEAVRYANAAGALTTTRAGAQPSLPLPDEVRRLLDEGSAP